MLINSGMTYYNINDRTYSKLKWQAMQCVLEKVKWKLNSCGTSTPLKKFVTGLLKAGFGSL